MGKILFSNSGHREGGKPVAINVEPSKLTEWNERLY